MECGAGKEALEHTLSMSVVRTQPPTDLREVVEHEPQNVPHLPKVEGTHNVNASSCELMECSWGHTTIVSLDTAAGSASTGGYRKFSESKTPVDMRILRARRSWKGTNCAL